MQKKFGGLNLFPSNYKTIEKYILENKSNPFGAPSFFTETTGSTMDDARLFVQEGASDGTTIRCSHQSAGRGRVKGRTWESKKEESLLCTTILRRTPISGFTLRVGLAIARTLEIFLPSTIQLQIKWPNDVIYNGKKLSGILCENVENIVFVGIGINWAQKQFPKNLEAKATSLAMLCETFGTKNFPTLTHLLDCYLHTLKDVLDEKTWHTDVSNRLYLRNNFFDFLPGNPNISQPIRGRIKGIGPLGELLFLENADLKNNKPEKFHSFFSGEFC